MSHALLSFSAKQELRSWFSWVGLNASEVACPEDVVIMAHPALRTAVSAALLHTFQC